MEREMLKKAFQIKKSPVEVCLLIHGFCGSPSEMRFLAQHKRPDTVTLLAPALRLADSRTALAGALKHVMPYREWDKLPLPGIAQS